ncbi:ROK family protein [Lactobacillus sp. ESL0731]|uniref:ROK family protein n=1 Tax=unclassified Lactobacillus TaxID=2620435 RepID=UPI0023F653B1|nr:MULTISPECIES: ROK family protein [unclassified Lactobacillus]WEV51211.1 ROK family protein [Lactobacillus sp. ESL0700]WEV62341.1 ROK family protein [Lactobacillus sp. ESL0731]
MKLAVFDIGGTTVKTGIYENEHITEQASFKTPKTFTALKEKMHEFIDQGHFTGLAISAPGDVNVQAGTIEGISQVPYLHKRPIFAELKAEFGLPLTIENDANCAGICETKIGNGRQFKNVAFIVIGTGIGGAVFINHELHRGSHLVGGEFGFMRGRTDRMLSMDAPIVKAAKIYSRKTKTEVDGKKLFALASQGDELAQSLVNRFYDLLASSMYDLQVSFDFDAFLLGGGVSARSEISAEIAQRLKQKLTEFGMARIMPQVMTCQYHNSANLYGAALNFIAQM